MFSPPETPRSAEKPLLPVQQQCQSGGHLAGLHRQSVSVELAGSEWDHSPGPDQLAPHRQDSQAGEAGDQHHHRHHGEHRTENTPIQESYEGVMSTNKENTDTAFNEFKCQFSMEYYIVITSKSRWCCYFWCWGLHRPTRGERRDKGNAIH